MANFLLDTNCFIQAHQYYYPIDVANSFWSKLEELAHRDIITSIDKVEDEIFESKDDLTKWINSHLPDNFFNDTKNGQVVNKYGELVQWAQGKSDQYLQKALDDFMEYDNADPWLIAYAKIHNYTLVTYEKSSPNSKARIKIPDACRPFKVNCIDTIEMLRSLGETF